MCCCLFVWNQSFGVMPMLFVDSLFQSAHATDGCLCAPNRPAVKTAADAECVPAWCHFCVCLCLGALLPPGVFVSILRWSMRTSKSPATTLSFHTGYSGLPRISQPRRVPVFAQLRHCFSYR